MAMKEKLEKIFLWRCFLSFANKNTWESTKNYWFLTEDGKKLVLGEGSTKTKNKRKKKAFERGKLEGTRNFNFREVYLKWAGIKCCCDENSVFEGGQSFMGIWMRIEEKERFEDLLFFHQFDICLIIQVFATINEKLNYFYHFRDIFKQDHDWRGGTGLGNE